MTDHCDLIQEIPNLEKLPTSERLKQARKRRSQQLKRWQNYEKSLEKAARKGHGQGAGKLQRRGIRFAQNVVLLESAARNDLDEVRALLSNGVSPDVANEDGLTALHQVCIDDSEPMCRLLLDFKANVNARDSELWTPLHAAATCGHVHLCRILVDYGAELLAVNADGNMPYDICEDEITLEFIENEMAKRGVTQEQIDETRLGPEREMLKDLQAAAKRGIPLDTPDSQGATPLHIAAANGYMEVAEWLMSMRVRTDTKDDDGWKAVHIAACWGNPEIIEILVQHGADLEAKTRNGETVFDICEDGEQKQRLIELKQEIESNRLVRKSSLARRKSSMNTRGLGGLTASNGSIFDSSASLTRERSSLSASVRRSSVREKNLLSWKEARQEAQMRAKMEEDSPAAGAGDVKVDGSVNGHLSTPEQVTVSVIQESDVPDSEKPVIVEPLLPPAPQSGPRVSPPPAQLPVLPPPGGTLGANGHLQSRPGSGEPIRRFTGSTDQVVGGRDPQGQKHKSGKCCVIS